MPKTDLDPMGFILGLQFPTIFGPRRFADIVQPYQREWLDALCPDLVALASGKPCPGGRVWIEASKGCSKTSVVAACVLFLATYSRKAFDGIAGAVDKENAQELVRACRELLQENPWLGEAVDVQEWAIVGKQTGVRIEITASDRKGLHGGRYLFAFLDEIGHCDDGVFEYAEAIIANCGKVAGLLIAATNAGWLETKAYAFREVIRESPRWKFFQWAKPSPLMPLSEIEERRQQYHACPSAFNRLYLGHWGPKQEGNALNQSDIRRCVTLAGPTQTLPAGWMLPIAGLDVGLTNDKTGFSVVALDNLKRVALLETKSWKAPKGGQVDLNAVEEHVVNAHRRYGSFIKVMYDPWGFQSNAQRLVLWGVNMVPVHGTTANANQMAMRFPSALRDGHIALYDDRELLSDLGKFSIVEKTAPGFASAYKLTAPRDATGHADLGMAFVYAATMALVYADTLRTRETITAMEEQAERAKTGGRGPHSGRASRSTRPIR